MESISKAGAGPASLDLSRMREITQLRSVLDGFAARYAALRAVQGADVRSIWHAFERMTEAAQQEDYERFIVADRELHMAICEVANVPGLTDVWETCRRYWDSFRVETIRTCYPDLEMLLEAHRPIVQCVCEGNSHAAEDAARSHLDPVWYRLAEVRQSSGPRGDPLARTCAYLAFHLQEPITLSFLARKVAGTSAGHLARLFREQFRMSYTDYLRGLRMKKAAQLLEGTDLPVSHIGRAVGYRDASRFARHFRTIFGKSPRAFRQAYIRR
jgi:AraC-like DNA-binding protein